MDAREADPLSDPVPQFDGTVTAVAANGRPRPAARRPKAHPVEHAGTPTALLSLALLTTVGALPSGCASGPEARRDGAPSRPALPERPARRASGAFWEAWGDGRAELSGYRVRTPRYGALRDAEVVLVYVTEPLDRRTLIKDDAVPPEHALPVLKLNVSMRFQTGIYPYSILTSVFSPVDAYFEERFAPVKITLTAQEWCGHVFDALWPGRDAFVERSFSYFASDGEVDAHVEVPLGTLYEDALYIQLRELDGPFAGGGDWRGSLVPSLWGARKAHVPPRPVNASITREDGGDVVRFVLRHGDVERRFEVEKGGAHRILRWSASDGETAELLRTARLPYWNLNGVGDERWREELGLPPLGPVTASPASAPDEAGASTR
jgi:hypothetical protein